jgi:hypothetical protein
MGYRTAEPGPGTAFFGYKGFKRKPLNLIKWSLLFQIYAGCKTRILTDSKRSLAFSR